MDNRNSDEEKKTICKAGRSVDNNRIQWMWGKKRIRLKFSMGQYRKPQQFHNKFINMYTISFNAWY